MNKSLFALVHVAFLFFVTGCDQPGGSVEPIIKGTTHAGKPGNFNGTWAGSGFIDINSAITSNLSFSMAVSKLPSAMTVDISIHDQLTEIYHLNFSQLKIVKNRISNELNQIVGDIGADGFTIREIQGSMLTNENESGVITLQGVIYLTDGREVKFESYLSKQ
jgi:hypothetical protein